MPARLLPLVFAGALLLLLGACAAPQATVRSAAEPAAVATLKGDAAGAPQDFMGDEIACRLHSIDGESVGPTSTLRPGRHTLIVTLGHAGREYVGVVQLLIPQPRSYRVSARKRDDAVTMTLVDETAAKIVATSTAALAEQMNFTVFVVQK
jgi:hypothetical protein